MKRRALLLAFCLSLSATMAQTPSDEARRSAEQWLALVDASNYAVSWQQAGSVFQSSVSAEQWRQSLSAVREPLGSVERRAVKSAHATRSLPGVPDGQYVVFQFDSAFRSKPTAVETVTAALQSDGSWKVVGYFVK